MRFLLSFVLFAVAGLAVASPAPDVAQSTNEERAIEARQARPRPFGMQQSGDSIQAREARPRPPRSVSSTDENGMKKMKRDDANPEGRGPRPWGGRSLSAEQQGEGAVMEERGQPGRTWKRDDELDANEAMARGRFWTRDGDELDSNEDMARGSAWKRDGGEPDTNEDMPRGRGWKRGDAEPDTNEAMPRHRYWKERDTADTAEPAASYPRPI